MCNADSSVSRTLISSKATQLQGASPGLLQTCPQEAPRSLQQKFIFSKTDLLTLLFSDPLEDNEREMPRCVSDLQAIYLLWWSGADAEGMWEI